MGLAQRRAVCSVQGRLAMQGRLAQCRAVLPNAGPYVLSMQGRLPTPIHGRLLTQCRAVCSLHATPSAQCRAVSAQRRLLNVGLAQRRAVCSVQGRLAMQGRLAQCRAVLPNAGPSPGRACRLDRIAARLVAIFVRDLDIAYVHDFLRMNGLSFLVFFTKHQDARSRYRRSNPNSLIGIPSPTLSVHSLNLRKLSLHRSRHIHNFVSVRILRNLDVLGLVPDYLSDLLLSDGFRFSARSF